MRRFQTVFWLVFSFKWTTLVVRWSPVSRRANIFSRLRLLALEHYVYFLLGERELRCYREKVYDELEISSESRSSVISSSPITWSKAVINSSIVQLSTRYRSSWASFLVVMENFLRIVRIKPNDAGCVPAFKS